VLLLPEADAGAHAGRILPALQLLGLQRVNGGGSLLGRVRQRRSPGPGLAAPRGRAAGTGYRGGLGLRRVGGGGDVEDGDD
jgi:hypothetical protein